MALYYVHVRRVYVYMYNVMTLYWYTHRYGLAYPRGLAANSLEELESDLAFECKPIPLLAFELLTLLRTAFGFDLRTAPPSLGKDALPTPEDC